MLGRQKIWSDHRIQTLSRNFVCVIDNVFYLRPPPIVKFSNQTESTAIFDRYVESAPEGIWPPESKTLQGLYVLQPNGNFLSGGFSYQSKYSAQRILNQGWDQWSKIVVGESKSVPSEPIPVVGGRPECDHYVKFQISYRDLPRGWNKRPGDAQFHNPYNLNWYDLSQRDLRKLVLSGNDHVLKKLALATLKDSVRGEMIDWRHTDWQGGKIESRLSHQDGAVAHYYLEGWAEMKRPEKNIAYYTKLYAKASYDHDQKQFMDFQLISAGQRSGAGPFNGRSNDLQPAPMGIVIRMH